MGGGILEPSEFEIVRDVFKRIVREAPFRNDIGALHAFGLMVLHAYQAGHKDATVLYDHCLAASKSFAN